MKLTPNLWEQGIARFLFSEVKLSAANNGEQYLRSRFKLLCSFFSDIQFSLDNFNEFIYAMQQRKCSHAYMNNMIKLAKHINQYCIDKLQYDPGIGEYTYFKRERKVPIIFTTEEIKAIFTLKYPYSRSKDLKNKKFQSLFRLLPEAGLRISEARYITWDWLIPDYSVKVSGKFFKERIVPISKSLYEQLYALPRESEHIFTRERIRGSPLGTVLNIATIRDDLEKRKKYLKIYGKDKTLHKFRHYYATDLYRNGAPIGHIQRLLGHDNISSTQTYIHSVIDDLRETVMLYSSLQGGDESLQAVRESAITVTQKVVRNRYAINTKLIHRAIQPFT